MSEVEEFDLNDLFERYDSLDDLVNSISDPKTEKASTIRKRKERIRNARLKYLYSKLFSWMKQFEEEIGEENIANFVNSHNTVDKEIITFVVGKY